MQISVCAVLTHQAWHRLVIMQRGTTVLEMQLQLKPRSVDQVQM